MEKFSRQEIEEKVKEIIVDKHGVQAQDVTAEAKLDENLGMDSLDALELEMELEKVFSFTLDEQQAGIVRNNWTVGQVCDLVENLTK